MKIGILETGAPPADLIPRFGRYPAMFERLLGPGYGYRTWNVEAGELPGGPEAADAWLVTGSPAGVYDDLPWIQPAKAFLRAVKGKAPLVGVCFGHQLMAEAFGGRVEKSERGWGVGLHTYEVKARESWMDDARAISIPVSHQDQVVEQPPKTRVLAASAFTPYAALSYGDAVSFQCHPEFEPAYALALVEARRGTRLTGAEADAAAASLERPDDRARVAEWIRRFLA